MKTRDELLAMADEFIGDAGQTEDETIALVYATMAQACVMLAKELREGEVNVPIVVNVSSEKPLVDANWIVDALRKQDAKEA